MVAALGYTPKFETLYTRQIYFTRLSTLKEKFGWSSTVLGQVLTRLIPTVHVYRLSNPTSNGCPKHWTGLSSPVTEKHLKFPSLEHWEEKMCVNKTSHKYFMLISYDRLLCPGTKHHTYQQTPLKVQFLWTQQQEVTLLQWPTRLNQGSDSLKNLSWYLLVYKFYLDYQDSLPNFTQA